MTGWNTETRSDRKAKMRLPTIQAFAVAAMCLSSGLALADGEHETTMTLHIEEVGQRLAEIELIEVTAEKTPIESSEDVDAEIAAILEEAEAIEADESDD